MGGQKTCAMCVTLTTSKAIRVRHSHGLNSWLFVFICQKCHDRCIDIGWHSHWTGWRPESIGFARGRPIFNIANIPSLIFRHFHFVLLYSPLGTIPFHRKFPRHAMASIHSLPTTFTSSKSILMPWQRVGGAGSIHQPMSHSHMPSSPVHFGSFFLPLTSVSHSPRDIPLPALPLSICILINWRTDRWLLCNRPTHNNFIHLNPSISFAFSASHSRTRPKCQ